MVSAPEAPPRSNPTMMDPHVEVAKGRRHAGDGGAQSIRRARRPPAHLGRTDDATR